MVVQQPREVDIAVFEHHVDQTLVAEDLRVDQLDDVGRVPQLLEERDLVDKALYRFRVLVAEPHTLQRQSGNGSKGKNKAGRENKVRESRARDDGDD